MKTCPVCRAKSPLPFLSVDGRDYWRCTCCEGRFLDPCQHPSRDCEYRQYLHHENDVEDAGYRRFLSKLASPLLARLQDGSRGLDFGCGPGPALAAIMREANHEMAIYDPFFYPDRGPLEQCYDFVTCSEVVEHFFQPAEEFDNLDRLLRPGGWLAIMTCFQTEDSLFTGWHYRKDPTHVVFYREETMQHIAACRGWSCDIPAKNVALMQKPGKYALSLEGRQAP